MDLKVEALLKFESLIDSRVIAGKLGIDNIIKGVTIMEAPDIANWIKGGELILTSLHTLNTLDTDELENIIIGLYKKNVSSIAIKRRTGEEVMPDIIIVLGDKYNIPIILLPSDVPFLDIMNPVMASIFNRQMVILSHYKDVHNKFTNLALENKELDDIVKTLSELLKNPVTVYDRNFKSLCSSDPRIVQYDVVDDGQEIKTLNELKYIKRKVKFEFLNDEEVNQILLSIKTFNNLTVYLAIAEINRELEELDFITIGHAVIVISLDLVKQFSISQVEKRYESDFLDDLINGNIKERDELYEKARIVGLNFNNRHIICSFKISSAEKCLKYDMNNIASITLNSLYDEINNNFDKCFVRVRANDVTVICDVEDWINNNINPLINIKKNISRIQNRLNNKQDNIVITVGISNILDSIINIDEHFKESIEALELGKIMYSEGSITSFDELGILRLLCKVESNINLIDYIPKELRKLREYDKENNSDLVYTLEMFINNGLNASKAAKSMYLHYKTIKYRLDKIETIADIDIKDNEKILEIQLGLKILKVLNSR